MANFYGSYPASSSGGGAGTGFVATGSAVLIGGTVTVSSANVKSASIIFLTCLVAGGTQGFLSVGTITNGVSFVINSTNASDTSTISWGFV